MARKVFMSVLGTGFYGKCRYQSGDFISQETRFIQQATLEKLFYSEKWTNQDAIYILLTDKANELNWDTSASGKRRRGGAETEEDYIGLKEELDNIGIKVQKVDIKEGNTEEDLWENFSIIYDQLQEDDELYFDITHSFRYLPMFVLVLMNYAKFLKHIKVKFVSYGNYESRDQQSIAPLMNLTTLVKLQEWTNAAADFIDSGHVKSFTETVSLSCDRRVKGFISEEIKLLNKNLNEFEGQISTCRGKQLFEGKTTSEIKRHICNVKEREILPIPLSNILDRITEAIEVFHPSSFENLIQSINWCKRYNLIQQGFTLCQESIITFLCDKFAEKNPYKNDIRKYRDYWASILGVDERTMRDESLWKNGLKENIELSRYLFNNNLVKQLRRSYSTITRYRNTINHAGFTGEIYFKDIKKNFHKSIKQCIDLLNIKDINARQKVSNILINLSNHPYSQWSEEQKEAAKIYGECKDLPFPQIDPMSDEKDIEKRVEEFANKIFEIAQEKNVTVHIMGEMAFTFSIITRLKAEGIRCICSTSYRIVKDEGNGKRYVEFQFKRFRNYEG